ncbi:hypothetical protein [Facklamia miroungae]|uniref:Glutaredoxin-related protein n=1 Tax=Facklamia miroungae TaxID=120956 RepID=A0A1G7QVX6_9LACT|nr:hypothetical protein [Facklamia miroungae]NKZ29059.1 hypothetical protein [Facklamia miroungae]SDG01820.1 Glutaredoxin-related protein [Facklamia miroungae]
MNKVYFSDKCPNTTDFVNQLDQLQISYEAVNITDSMNNLKEFLKLRDSRKEFDVAKKNGNVGIPVLYAEGRLIYDLEQIDEK